jgi:leucyl aminopeptidase
VGESVNVTRDLVNGPGNEITPSRIAATARELGRKVGFKVKVMGRDECEKLGMGAFLAVAQGSDEPCKFIVMEYEGGTRGTVCLVGKGVTFDTGGISLKPAAEMDLMKYDMGGSGAVLGAMHFAAVHRVPMKVVGIVASTENMPGGRAYKPGDIVTASNGVTIDVKNTDAEGRLILADALALAVEQGPDALVELSTLTGACVVALGHHGAGLYSPDDELAAGLLAGAEAGGERLWRLPLWPEFAEEMQGTHADLKNAGGRWGGANTAAAFLASFLGEHRRWAHLDIAGPAQVAKEDNGSNGATGYGVPLIVNWLRGLSG